MVSTTAGQNPFFQARSAAVTQLAVFEAVNAIDRDFDPYLGTIHAPRTASEEAAAIAAAHAVLKNYFPANAAALDAARATSLAAIRRWHPQRTGNCSGRGGCGGDDRAARRRRLHAAGVLQTHLCGRCGEWQPTPSCPPAGGILLQWRNLRPFAIETTAQFRSAPPPALKSLRYARDYWEVRLVGDVEQSVPAAGSRRRGAVLRGDCARARCGTQQRHRSLQSRAARCPRAPARSRW